MTPLAHAGHWFQQILYLFPVLAMVAALAWAKYKERRRSERDSDV